MDITYGIDQMRIKGKDGEIYTHELAARNYMFTCDGVSYNSNEVAIMSGITTQRIRGAIEGARALRGISSKIFEQCKNIAEIVRENDDALAQDVKTILANRKVRV